jgi:hypothetical protein
MKMRHETSKEPATYARGTKRLDYILMSERCAISVRQCGYEPFNHHLFSDHRGMFVDMDTEMLFGNFDNVLAAMQYCDFTARDPKAVSDYLQSVGAYLHDHNFSARLQRLKTSDTNDHALAETLDKDLRRACILAATHCRKMRQTPRSPTVIKARDTVNILKRLLSMFRTHMNMHKSIHKFRSKAGQRRTLPSNEKDCGMRLAQALLRKVVKEAAAHWRDHLENLAEIYSLREDKDKSAILKQIIKAEDIKAMYAKIQAIRKHQSRQGISQLEVPVNPDDDPKTCTHWQTVNLPKEILALLRKRNQEHFGQAAGTPFTVGTLRQDFDFEGATQTRELILEGKYTNAKTDAITSAAIKFAKKHTTLNSRTWHITEKEFLDKIKNWKESTST